ncbi:MAG: 3-oxoacyl-ACP reductase FabG [Clostridia bacterium]|nr:3-oxoacyl-ACP reductase FabG [Clostridia bacterium]
MNKRKSVLITGASRGIGKATSEIFAKAGYNVIINYLHSQKEAHMLADDLTRQNCHVRLFQADISKRKEVDAMIDFCIDTFGGLDILINNAGISQSKLFVDITESDWDHMISVNLKGIFNCSQSALRYMLPNKNGKIINISSIWGITGASCEVHYSAAKAGIIGLTKALAKELGPSNIHVNCIAPGIINTTMMTGYSTADINALKDQTPLGTLGSSEDIAKLALYLASEDSNFITGQVISPNGGFVI